jgi:hypothetical protein
MYNYTEQDRLFDDIRPYRDSEVEDILKRFLNSPDYETNINILLGQYMSFYSEDKKKEITGNFRKTLEKIKTVEEFQKEIVLKFMLEPVISNTIDSLTGSGFEKLEREKGYLFIGNHRDITLDPALLNYLLFSKGLDSVEIAFGDNLLINEFVTGMIRINKSFIVKRNLPLAKQLESVKHLSGYIYHTMQQMRSVWIAQKEGRAKDGNDITNPAVISMLYLSQIERFTLPDFLTKVNLTPVAVSYEFDPCDRLKALEIIKQRKAGGQKKSAADDLASINSGITGYKGRVHYSVVRPFNITGATVKDIAKELDRAIHLSYHLWSVNYLAFDIQNNTSNYSAFYNSGDENKFNERIKRLSQEIRALVIEGYANPVKNYEAINR